MSVTDATPLLCPGRSSGISEDCLVASAYVGFLASDFHCERQNQGAALGVLKPLPPGLPRADSPSVCTFSSPRRGLMVQESPLASAAFSSASLVLFLS